MIWAGKWVWGGGTGAHLEVQDLVRTFSDTKEQCNYIHIDLAVALRQTPGPLYVSFPLHEGCCSLPSDTGGSDHGLWLSRTIPPCVLELPSAPSDHAIWMWNYLNTDGGKQTHFSVSSVGDESIFRRETSPLKREP